MVDKNYCMSSYLAFRYIADDNKDFAEGITHSKDSLFNTAEKIPVRTAEEIASAYDSLFRKKDDVRLGLLLSGGMDSACLAAFLNPGTDVYTFRFLNGTLGSEEMERAKLYAEKYQLKLHYVDIDWHIVEKNLDILMTRKGAPVHSIEPQIMEAALQAKADGVEMMVAADGSDLTFGGMNKMLSKDWSFDEWVDFYTFCKPESVLKEPVDMSFLFEKYRLPENKIDYLSFINDVFGYESSGSYCNAFICADMKYKPFYDPSGMVVMAEPLDLHRVRNGESKYLIRDLFRMKYPGIPVPEKIPMPRPVDFYFKDWEGPTRPEFRQNLDMTKYTGNQKWQLWCLERFLNLIES
ncbi:MAG: 7-cyano-7-deazaguanine synthase [Clostridia bacterium]|nr:7-cyano-7-deazaguanine synthase [Clostridia bacterium]